MSAGFPQIVNVGTIPGDGTGDPAPIPFQKYNATVVDIYNTLAGAGLQLPSYLSVSLSTALTHDYNPGGGWPGSIGFLDITVTGQNCTVDGLFAPGQWTEVVVRCNPASTFNLILGITGSGSLPVNQFSGPAGSIALIPGFCQPLTYLPGPNYWAVL